MTPSDRTLPASPYAKYEFEWHYDKPPDSDGDCRRIVTLRGEMNMVWVGIRAWDAARKCWLNNNEPDTSEILAWAYLPVPAPKRYVRGLLVG